MTANTTAPDEGCVPVEALPADQQADHCLGSCTKETAAHSGSQLFDLGSDGEAKCPMLIGIEMHAVYR